MELTRRSLMTYSAGATLAGALWGTKSVWGGANEKARVAVMGIHGMGQNHIRSYQALPNVEVAALCDVDENLFAERVQNDFVAKGLNAPMLYSDIRELLDDQSIDAVSIAAPNHWHALAAIWSIQAGKHVSVEKPCCHTFFEGQKLVEASRKYNVIVQDGSEQRSNPCGQSMAKFLQEGGLGEVYMAQGLCYKRRDTIGSYPDEAVPPGVDYDLWLGPARRRAFNKNRFHYNWHWNWEYGNGDMGNQGVHEMDIARWGLGVTLPTRVSAIGGHFMFEDAQQTPNVLTANFEFPNKEAGGDKKKMLQFEVRHWATNRADAMWMAPNADAPTGYKISAVNVVGNLFFGSKGYMAKDVSQWKAFMDKDGEPGATGSGLGNHYANFIDAIRSGNPKEFNKSIEEGFYSSALIHLANISYRLGRTLDFDPETMRFVNDDQANGMLRRQYRRPFVVEDKV